ncbi:MAG: tocopherol cyclase family protein, partial [Anaerolineales bacterium]|nr:tocopherol cyclase family protein [Anaerolineales bacterium]
MNFIRRVLNPAWYHGHRARPPFFEGWYYKLVDASGRHKMAVIPGIFLGRPDQESHAFIQILDGVTSASHYASYPTGAFSAKPDAFAVRIAGSSFGLQRLVLDIDQPDLKVTGEIRLGALIPWPVSLLSPGIMGWYAWIPMMECFHGVLSMDHALEGTLRFNGEEIDFTGGRGYLEKDWGRAFPRGYIWFQSNHFGQPGISLTASVAIIPWVRRPFPGFIIGFHHDGTLYRFATYNGARTSHLTIDD